MWNGKNKAITFSFDDGVIQDRRVVAILEKYGLKGTFNLNSERFDLTFTTSWGFTRSTIPASEVKELYKNHEVAVHTLTHPNLTEQTEEEVIRQVDEDRKNLEALVGYPIRCMAYPCGGVNNDDRVAEIIKKNTPIRFSRTITSTNAYDLQDNLLRFNPTFHCAAIKNSWKVVEEFLALNTDKPQVLYIWGHTYEMDEGSLSWEEFEKLCQMVSGKDDIFYGTNSEVFFND